MRGEREMVFLIDEPLLKWWAWCDASLRSPFHIANEQ
jgi:hypothetical protein